MMDKVTPKAGNRYPFTVKDLANPVRRAEAQWLGETVQRLNSEAGGCIGSSLIIEDFGTTLKQAAWHDVCGRYVEFRIAPLDSHLPAVQAAAMKLVELLKERYAPEGCHTHEMQSVGSEGSPACLFSVVTKTYSIGD